MDQTAIDQQWMAQAIALAEKGAGRTSPNPIVGALVVKNGVEIGRGYHHRAGGPHAEMLALKQAGAAASGATLYVSLEPCSHWGKTPPCVDAILGAGIATVVCAMEDPNPQVSGAGIRHLRANGVGVRTGVLQREAMRQNEAHIKFMVTGRPLIVVKIAQTLDGKIATTNGGGEMITGAAARRFVHALRARYDAVLVGKNTVLKDDPQLTVRTVRGRDPLRLVLDSWGKLPSTMRLFSQNEDRRTVRIGLSIGRRPVTAPHPDCFDWYVEPDDRHQVSLQEVLDRAAKSNITSILVEGGGEVFGSFFRERLVDKVHLIISMRFLGAGVDALGRWKAPSLPEAVRLVDSEVCWLGHDLLITGYPDYEPQETAEPEVAAESSDEPTDEDDTEAGSLIEQTNVEDR
ncbi:MAG: bifunctional diaminohydroxyphosphoribosylaminopyrimidine deaminase/5-amino-6-(5-phosphoribosylamino)uracil reductase RibD [Candidatus Zixiibacteriota bacterium]